LPTNLIIAAPKVTTNAKQNYLTRAKAFLNEKINFSSLALIQLYMTGFTIYPCYFSAFFLFLIVHSRKLIDTTARLPLVLNLSCFLYL